MNAKSNSLKTKSPNDTKSEALLIAKTYLQTLGFNGFSFQTIADALGIRKASLHYYFSSKEDMGIALLKEYEIAFENWIVKVEKLSALDKLDKLANIFIRMHDDGKMICPTGVLTSDFNTLSAKMKKRLKEFHFLQREWIIKALEQGKKERTIRSEIDTKLTADLIISTLQGGLQTARLRGEKDILKKMSNVLFETLYA
jgi:TetR/AcrR family transcriptional repressor of nem operon